MGSHQNSYSLDWIIKLVKQQAPERKDIIDALQRCENGQWDSKAYLRFVDSTNANLPGAVWQIEESVVFVHEIDGDIVIDLLKGGIIGGIEFVSSKEK